MKYLKIFKKICCPYCGSRRHELIMVSYAGGLDRPVFFYRCRGCGKIFEQKDEAG